MTHKPNVVIPFRVIRWGTGKRVTNELVYPITPYSVRAAMAAKDWMWDYYKNKK